MATTKISLKYIVHLKKKKNESFLPPSRFFLAKHGCFSNLLCDMDFSLIIIYDKVLLSLKILNILTSEFHLMVDWYDFLLCLYYHWPPDVCTSNYECINTNLLN